MKTRLTKSDIDEIVGLDTGDLIDTWDEFVGFRARTAKTKIVSRESEARIFKMLSKMSKNIQKLKAIVEQTIDNGWMGFFEPKDWHETDIDFETVTRQELDKCPPDVHAKMKRGHLRRYMQLYPEKY